MSPRSNARAGTFPIATAFQIERVPVNLFQISISRYAMGADRITTLRAFEQKNVYEGQVGACHMGLPQRIPAINYEIPRRNRAASIRVPHGPCLIEVLWVRNKRRLPGNSFLGD